MSNIFQYIIKKAKDKTSWRNRLEALREMKSCDFEQKKDLIIQMALHDRVFAVKEEAFRIAQSLGYKKHGKAFFLSKKDIGYKNKDFVKLFKKIKKQMEMDELDLASFKSKFKKIDPEMYDVMMFEKGEGFDEWIKNIFISLPKK